MIELRVRYPPGPRITLRTSHDWSRDVEPVAVLDDGVERLFRVERPAEGPPLVYAKPVRPRGPSAPGDDVAWAVGTNYLLVPGVQTIYPHFDGAERGRLSDRQQIVGRTVRVFLPPGYDENTMKRYPTLYVLDGANIFLPEEAFGGTDWALDDTLARLDALNLIDRMVVVAVYSEPDRRELEYTSPGYVRFGEHLAHELLPAIARRYRTLDGPEHTAIMGSSLGGVAALHVGWAHRQQVGMVACLSSTFSYRDDLLRRAWAQSPAGVRVYLDAGLPNDNYGVTRELYDTLVARGLTPGRDLLFLGFPGALHHERSWAQRVHLPLQFFFGRAFRATRSRC